MTVSDMRSGPREILAQTYSRPLSVRCGSGFAMTPIILGLIASSLSVAHAADGSAGEEPSLTGNSLEVFFIYVPAMVLAGIITIVTYVIVARNVSRSRSRMVLILRMIVISHAICIVLACAGTLFGNSLYSLYSLILSVATPMTLVLSALAPLRAYTVLRPLSATASDHRRRAVHRQRSPDGNASLERRIHVCLLPSRRHARCLYSSVASPTACLGRVI